VVPPLLPPRRPSLVVVFMAGIASAKRLPPKSMNTPNGGAAARARQLMWSTAPGLPAIRSKSLFIVCKDKGGKVIYDKELH
jgi:hypothetical protein